MNNLAFYTPCLKNSRKYLNWLESKKEKEEKGSWEYYRIWRQLIHWEPSRTSALFLFPVSDFHCITASFSINLISLFFMYIANLQLASFSFTYKSTQYWHIFFLYMCNYNYNLTCIRKRIGLTKFGSILFPWLNKWWAQIHTRTQLSDKGVTVSWAGTPKGIFNCSPNWETLN